MKPILKKSLILILAIIILLPTVAFGASTTSIQSNEKEPDLYFFVEVFEYIKEKYPFQVENKHLIE